VSTGINFSPATNAVPKRTVHLTSCAVPQRIRFITDTHQDAEFFRKDIFRRFVKEQKKDKDSLWLHGGDLPDSDRPSTRQMKKLMYSDRSEAFDQEDKRNLDWLDRSIIPQYQDIADSCLGIIDGDHYMVFNNGMTSGQYISRKLKVPYLGERSSFVSVCFHAPGSSNSLQYIIHARHGKTAAPTHGGDVNALVRQEVSHWADLHLGGHSHKSNCHSERIEYVTHQGIIKNRVVWYMRGGSFLDGFPTFSGKKTYAYRKEYSPLPVGWGEVELKLGRMYRGKNLACPLEVQMSKASIIAA